MTVVTHQSEGWFSRESRYLKSVWERRDYIRYAAQASLRQQHFGSLLGNVWHLLNPVLSILIYYLLFGIILETTRGAENFFSFLTVGTFTFEWTRKSMTTHITSISANESLIRALQFPRIILPLTSLYEEFLLFLPTVVLSIVVGLSMGDDVFSPTFALLPVLLLLQVMFLLGVGLIVARLGDIADDVNRLLPYFLRLVFYVSGVMWSVDSFIESERIKALFLFNPFYVFVEISRIVLLGYEYQSDLMLSAIAWSVGSTVLGYHMFRRGEPKFGRPDR